MLRLSKQAGLLIVFIMIVFMLPAAGMGAFDYTVDSWYAVEPWEVEVCSKWGGLSEAQKHTDSATGETRLFQLSATLQGEKKTILLEDREQSFIYEASWYLQPLKGEESYTVSFMTSDGDKVKIYEGSAQAVTGDSDYYVEENDKEYTHVIMEYDSGSLSVPVVIGG